ncbi:M20 family metallo-hydrolase [Turneriella parva]|uniref:Amidase, hydantoinase/carbamoylase family n=1 Tax=Turneriella parva (strain ATCC BAA-1111 / DSM 21527 / NCTC 11395 / H) TaxID=869212 RepID=I4B3T9_TURPD|nr:M20 family metallo-hydrolase [Turneriella parva]AFM11946.1 amidase, hydantoinase/carbamoylase family [Turneriella parva DSM 21527]
MPSMPKITVNAQRVSDELEKLARFSDHDYPAVTRIIFTENDIKARDYFKSLAREAGLHVREDSIGNIFVRLGDESALGAIGTGSHCDAVPHAGRFDGTVGVFGGLEALRALKTAGFQPKRPIEVVFFTSEEPTRFGIGCIGSRIMSNTIALDKVAALRDKDGLSFDEARGSAGYKGTVESAILPKGYYDYFVELHIEQGPVLEREKKQIGIVTGIAAPASFRIHFTGEGGHAGGVLMPARKDALVPCAILIQEAERLAKASPSPDTVATVGVVKVHPGAINSIPAKATVEFDIRDIRLETRDAVVTAVKTLAKRLADERGLKVEIEDINSDPPAVSDETILKVAEAATETRGYSHMRLPSRAYHDSLFIARIAPMGMIFVPSKSGYSHRSDEYTSPEEIGRGVEILAQTMAELSLR